MRPYIQGQQQKFLRMILISPGQVTPSILTLFDLTKPTMPRAFNVLEGTMRGQILVDDLAQPSWAVVQETIFGTLYVGGQVHEPLLSCLVQHFRKMSDVGVGCWLDESLNDMLPPDPDYDGRTLYFTDRAPPPAPLMARLPPGYSLLPRDHQVLRQSFDYEKTMEVFRTEENALQHTLGFMVFRDGKVVCEAATGAPTQGRIEVGVTTAEPYRQRGLATIACIHLIEQCEAQGYATWWDCAKQNTASVHLARKLGYQNEQEYRFVWWAKRN